MKINIKNMQKINAALEGAEGKATARLADQSDVLAFAAKIEKRLVSLKVQKKDRIGMRFDVNVHMQKFPSKYKYSPMGTCFSLQICKSGFFMTSAYRSGCDGSPSREIQFVNEYKYWIFYRF